MTTLAVAQTAFQVENQRSLKYPAKKSERIYYAACRKVAEELNLQNPKTLRPSVTLKLGEKDDHLETVGESSVISLRHWDENLFAYAVAKAALTSAINIKKLEALTAETISIVNATIDVEEMK